MANRSLHPAAAVESQVPARNGAAVTPSDSTDLPIDCRAFYVGTAGNVVVDFVDSGSSITFVGMLGGQVFPYAVKRIRATGTTALNSVALW